MTTTIKLETYTKEKLTKLDIAEKGKSFDTIVNQLITFYEKNNKHQKKREKEYDEQMKEYKKSLKVYQQQQVKYNQEQKTWDNLLKWAKSKGFKG